MPKRATYVNQVRKSHQHVITVGAGDLLGWQPDRMRHRLLLEMVNEIGYDALGIGDNDLVDGVPFLQEEAGRLSLPFLSASISDSETKSPLGLNYRVVSTGRVDVGIIAVADPAAFVLMKPEQRTRVAVRPGHEVLSQLLPEVQGQVDLVVVLSHASLSQNRSLARVFPSVDVIVGSYSGRPMPEPVTEDGVIIVQAGKNGAHMGRLDLYLDKDNSIKEYRGWLEPLLESVPDDAIIAGMVAEYRQELLVTASSAHNESSVDGPYLGAATCQPCHQEQFQQWETTTHAHAMETLIQAGQAESAECLFCHTTGYGRPSGFLDAVTTPSLVDVQCEVCHRVAEQHAENPGLPSPATPVTCIECHTPTQSPSFRYEEAITRIRH